MPPKKSNPQSGEVVIPEAEIQDTMRQLAGSYQHDIQSLIRDAGSFRISKEQNRQRKYVLDSNEVRVQARRKQHIIERSNNNVAERAKDWN